MTDMKPFGELSDAEKGALLLEHHEGKRIEVGSYDYPCSMIWDARPDPSWAPGAVYRIAPEPLIPDSIDWSHVAPEVVAMARNNDDKTSRLFKTIPFVENWWCGEVCADAKYFASYRRGTVDWRNSLVVRPWIRDKTSSPTAL
jgi:hypothetical protein